MKIKPLVFSSLAISSLSLSTTIIAQPQHSSDNHSKITTQWRSTSDLNGCRFVFIDSRQGNWSATDPAYALTTPGCVSKLPHKTVFTQPGITPAPQTEHGVKKVAWKSTQGVLLALVELETPIGDLLDQGIEPIKLADQPPAAGEKVLLLALNHDNEEVSRVCDQQPPVDTTRWRQAFPGTQKNHCTVSRDIANGVFITEQTEELFAVLNTAVHDNSTGLCLDKHPTPCEIKDNNSVLLPSVNYGSSAHFMSGCFLDGNFNLDQSTCPLLPTQTINTVKLNTTNTSSASSPRQTWDMKVSTETPYYHHKTVQNVSECMNTENYSAAIKKEQSHINTAIGDDDGLYMLCIIGTDSEQQLGQKSQVINAYATAVKVGA